MIDDYSGLQKAAILLITLGPEKASAIFRPYGLRKAKESVLRVLDIQL